MTANIWRRLDSPLAWKIVIFPSSFPLFFPLSPKSSECSTPEREASTAARRDNCARQRGKVMPRRFQMLLFHARLPKIIDGLAVLVYHRHDFRPPLPRIIRGATSFSTSEITASLKARATVPAIIYLGLTSNSVCRR